MSSIFRPVWSPLISPIAAAVTAARRNGGASLPAPTTANFTSAQFVAGFAGSISTTKNAARVYGRGALTLWAGMITGTEAKLTVTSDFGASAGLIQVAIDGGAFSSAPNTGTLYTLFTGLPHAARFVEIRYGSSFADAPYILSTGNVLAVTGQPPAVVPFTAWIQPVTAAANCGTVANVATYTPPLVAVRGNPYGSNIGSAKLRGAFTKLAVLTSSSPNRVGVSKNGAAPTYYEVATEANSPSRAILIPCDGTDATYYVWNGGTAKSLGGHFAVSGDSALLDAGTLYHMDQYGDSITYGTGPGATPADVETMPVAAALGMIGSTNGIGGYTIAQCKTLLDSVLPTKVVTGNDVAILAIGRNDVQGGIDATDQADYLSCINKLLAKGYGKILCRAVLPTPDGSSLWAVQNAALESVVTTLGDPNVIWVPTSTWLGYGSSDTTHPTAAGYVPTLMDYAVPAYTSALGL